MTTLECFLLFVLYIINGAFMFHKQINSSLDIDKPDKFLFSFFAFALNPFWLVGVAIIKVIFKKW